MTVRPGTQDARGPRIAAVACACVMGAAAVALATTPKHPGHDARAVARGGAAAQSDVPAAAAAARAFVEDYLAWLAGRRAPRRVRGASAALRDRLAGDRVRPSRVARRRRPRIAELHTQLTGQRSARAVARILDADTTFEVQLELERTASGWEVSDAHP